MPSQLQLPSQKDRFDKLEAAINDLNSTAVKRPAGLLGSDDQEEQKKINLQGLHSLEDQVTRAKDEYSAHSILIEDNKKRI